jgi:signal transduction histidine kinase
MQGLIKSGAGIRKFVPHSPVPAAVPDWKEGRAKGHRLAPILKAEGFDQLAHDARNVLAALRLYCELLGEPGVLSPENGHYARDLEAISDTASKLVEKLSAPRRAVSGTASRRSPQEADRVQSGKAREVKTLGLIDIQPAREIDDLARELLEMKPLLTGIASPRVEIEIATMPCSGRVRISREDLTRVMLNLVRNASEAMSQGGSVRITAQYANGLSFLDPGLALNGCPRTVSISVEDSGPGIPKEMRGEYFFRGSLRGRSRQTGLSRRTADWG